MLSSNLPADVSSVSLGDLQVADPAASLRLHAECQVLRQTSGTIGGSLRENLSLLVGIGSSGLNIGPQDLRKTIEGSLKYADLPLRPLLSSEDTPTTLPGFSITFQATDSHLLPHYARCQTSITCIHVSLLYSGTAHQSSNRRTTARGEDGDIIDPGSAGISPADQLCLPAAISLLDLALRTFISGKRDRSFTKGLVVESRNLEHTLADLSPRSFNPGYSASLLDRTKFIAGIARAFCSIQKKTISQDLNNAFEALHVFDNGSGEVKSSMKRKLFLLAERELCSPTRVGQLKPIQLRFSPDVTLTERGKVETSEDFTSLFEAESVADLVDWEPGHEEGSDGDEPPSEQFDSLFDETLALQEYDTDEDTYALLLDCDEVMLDGDPAVDYEDDDTWGEWPRDGDDMQVPKLECAMLF